ncbi:MAG TPA: DMT family transporter [Atribacteraceae bacterium]|nr:DMT family transporter [Atribacteraceae bacterium]
MQSRFWNDPRLWLVLVSVIWGFNFSIVKGGIMAVGPMSFSFTRFALSAVAMLLVLWKMEGGILIRKRDIPEFMLLGALGFGLYQPLWSWGLRLGLASHSAIILSISPVVVSIVTFFRKEEEVTWVNLLGVTIGFLGVFFLVRQNQEAIHPRDVLVANLLTFAAAFCWGLYSYYGRNMLRRYSPLLVSTWSILFGLCFMLPVSLPELMTVQVSEFGPVVWGALLYGTILSSLLAYIIWLNGVKKLGASRTLSFQYVIQVFGVLAAWLLFREPVGYGLLLGMFFVSLGLWLSQRKKRKS